MDQVERGHLPYTDSWASLRCAREYIPVVTVSESVMTKKEPTQYVAVVNMFTVEHGSDF